MNAGYYNKTQNDISVNNNFFNKTEINTRINSSSIFDSTAYYNKTYFDNCFNNINITTTSGSNSSAISDASINANFYNKTYLNNNFTSKVSADTAELDFVPLNNYLNLIWNTSINTNYFINNAYYTFAGLFGGCLDYCISYNTGQYQVMAFYNLTLFYSNNYGNTWIKIPQTNFDAKVYNSLCMSYDGSIVYATILYGNSGGVLKSTNYGRDWIAATTIPYSTTAFACSIATSSTGQYVTIVSRAEAFGSVSYSSDYGVNWRCDMSGNGFLPYDISISADGKYQSMTRLTSNMTGLFGNILWQNSNYGRGTFSLTNTSTSAGWYQSISDLPLNQMYTQGKIRISTTGQYQVLHQSRYDSSNNLHVSTDYGKTFVSKLQYYYNTGEDSPRRITMTASGKYQYVHTMRANPLYSSNYGSTWNTFYFMNFPNSIISGINVTQNNSYFGVCGTGYKSFFYFNNINTITNILKNSNESNTNCDLVVHGNLKISGVIEKGGGTFNIEHPLINNKRLVHSFVESPRCDLIYRGKVKLTNGKATVNMDKDSTHSIECAMTEGTFVSLCSNPTIYLQNNINFDKVIGDISGNILTIYCENLNSNTLVDWMVIAERKDETIKKWDKTNSDGFLITEYYTIEDLKLSTS